MRARLAASAALVALLALGTTGCTFITPQATATLYDPSDGIGTTLGGVEIENAALISEDGETASLLITLANQTDSGVQVNVQYENSEDAKITETVFVNSDAVKTLGGHDTDRLILTGIDAPPGSLFPVFFQYGDVTGQQLRLPVLAPTYEYEGLAPSSEPAP